MSVKENAAIVGIGATEFSKDSGRSEWRLAVEAVAAALKDGGVDPGDVDGMVTIATDNTDEIDVAKSLGTGDLRFFSRIPYGGGGGCGAVMQAALAVAAGVANVVVCYRAVNGRSGQRFGRPRVVPMNVSSQSVSSSWYSPFGLVTPAARAAVRACRYMHEVGVTSEDFGRIAVNGRKYAATNPAAWFYERPISLADHQESRLIADPLRLLDCCQESDGGVAMVITTVQRARHLRQPVVIVRAAAQAATWDQDVMTNYNRSSIGHLPEVGLLARQLWEMAEVGPRDVDVANIYDHFTPFVLMQLEELGFCARGEAAGFVQSGALELDGALPLNTNGGQLGEAYVHGFNGIAEAIRQVRGTAVNQVASVEVALVTSGSAIPTSGLVLGKE